MRICFLSSMFGAPWAGSELLWYATAKAALEDGHEVMISTKRWPKMPAPLVELGSLGARMYPRSVRLDRRASRLYERLIHPLPALVRWKPDVVCMSLGNFADAMARPDIQRFVRRIGAPYVLVIQQHYENHWVVPDEAARGRILRLFQGAARVGFVSERNRWAASQQLAIDLPNSCVLRNPISNTEIEPIPWPGPGIARFACVSRLDASDKGQDLLFAALSSEKWRSRDWVLRLYGDGRHREYLKGLVSYYKLAERVEFRGHVADVRSIWKDNHVLVLPSRCEGTPIALVEAMLWGRPAMVTDVGGNAEWVSEPRNGFVAEGLTVRSIGGAMERLWEARERWQTLGENARVDALPLFDPHTERTLLRMMTDVARPSTITSQSS